MNVINNKQEGKYAEISVQSLVFFGCSKTACIKDADKFITNI